MLETSSGFGNLAGFAVPAQVAASVGGPAQYVLSVTGQSPNSKNLSTTQGILQIDFYGNVTGQVVRDVNGTISTTTVSGKLTPQNTAGYGDAAGIYVLTLNFGGGQSSSYFVAASSQGIASLMGTNATEVSSGSLDIQEEFTSQE